MRGGDFPIDMAATVGKRIGRDVQDAHHERACQLEREAPAAKTRDVHLPERGLGRTCGLDQAGFADGAVPAPGVAPVVDDPLPDCVGFGGRGGRTAMMSSI